MLAWSAWLLAAGVLLGLVLVAVSQTSAHQSWWPGALHGALGTSALVLLLMGLRGPQRGLQQGAGSFGVVAATLLAVALGLGMLLVISRLRHRPPAMLVIGVHATLGVAALVMLAAYLSA